MYWIRYLKEYCKKSTPTTLYTAFLKWLSINDFELIAFETFIEELCITSDIIQSIMWRKVLSCAEDEQTAFKLLKELVDGGVFMWYTFLEGYKVKNYKEVFIDDFIKDEKEKQSFIKYLKDNDLY